MKFFQSWNRFSSLPDHLETFYSYRVKQFHGDETNYICPAKISRRETVISEFSMRVFQVLDLKTIVVSI